MSNYYMVYGKSPDKKRFAPLDAHGVPTSKSNAELFDSREDAQAFIDKHSPLKPGCEVDIRVAKV